MLRGLWGSDICLDLVCYLSFVFHSKYGIYKVRYRSVAVYDIIATFVSGQYGRTIVVGVEVMYFVH